MVSPANVPESQPVAASEGSGIRFDRDLAVRMSDGLNLMVNVFRPDADEPRPVILSVSPYGKDDLPQV